MTSKLIGQVDEVVPPSQRIFSFFNSRRAAAEREAEKINAELARHDIADVLIVVAAEQARKGDRTAAKKTFGEAMEMILGEPAGGLKTQRLRGLVEALAGAGEIEAARTAIEAIQGDEANKAKALVALAKAQARAGDRTSARASLSAAFDPAREIKADPNTINDNVAFRKDETFPRSPWCRSNWARSRMLCRPSPHTPTRTSRWRSRPRWRGSRHGRAT